MKVGVFTCWCGENIARTVDCEKVAELGLDAIVVAACAPHMHLKTFRKAVEMTFAILSIIVLSHLFPALSIAENTAGGWELFDYPFDPYCLNSICIFTFCQQTPRFTGLVGK